MEGLWGWIVWLATGAVIGWLASLIMGSSGSQGLIMDIVVGIVGALLGGWVFGLFGLADGGWWWSLITAIIGAVALIAILRLVTGGRKTT
ncbi:MAG: GlsB/YeaQ/YmgE family stress response membrane protein [Caldilineaceae bacterium]